MSFDYETYAARYDNERDFDKYLLRAKCDELFAFRKELGETLELGCAHGLMTEWVAPHTVTLDVVDASEEQVRFVEERMRRAHPEKFGSMMFHHEFFENFKPAKKFDTILLAGVLPALRDPIGFLSVAKEWLKDDGFIFVTSHNGLSLHRRIGKLMGLVKEETELSKRDLELFNHGKVYTFDSLKDDVEAAGLRVYLHTGVFLKPFPNDQMLEMQEDMIGAFRAVGKELDPRLLAEIVICAGKR